MFIPSYNTRMQIDIDLFYFLVFFQSMNAQLSADTTHFIAAPGCFVKGRIIAVDPGNTCADLLDYAKRTGSVGGEL